MKKTLGPHFLHHRCVPFLLRFFSFGALFCFGLLPVQNAFAAIATPVYSEGVNLRTFLVANAKPVLQNSYTAKAQNAETAVGNTAAPAQQAAEYGSWSIFHRDSDCTANIYYPQLNNVNIDSELYFWADQRLRSFVAGVGLLDDGGFTRFSLNIDYTISLAAQGYLTVIFKIITDTGGVRPDTSVATFTYDLNSGRRLAFADIFDFNTELTEFLSTYSKTVLLDRLGSADEELIDRGTAPNPRNFQFFALTTQGLDIYFPPYQVANSNWGEQVVSVPYATLMQFKPNPKIWGGKNGRFSIAH